MCAGQVERVKRWSSSEKGDVTRGSWSKREGETSFEKEGLC